MRFQFLKLALSFAFISAAASAFAQQPMMLAGKCQKLVFGKNDFSPHCQPKLISTAYANGRVGFYFLVGDKGVITISGTDLPNPTPQTDETKVDHIIVNLGIQGVPSASGKARGKCSYANPAKPMTIRCSGTMQGGDKFLAIFRTDGTAPE